MSGLLPSEMMEKQVPDKKLFVAASTTIPLWARNIFVVGAATLRLPNVSEAAHRKFTISTLTSATISLDFRNGAATGNVTSVTTAGEVVEFESNGVEWIVTQ